MTNDAPKRIWAWYIRTQNGIWLAKNCAQDKRPNHPDAIEYILEDHAQAEKEAAVAAEREACAGLVDEYKARADDREQVSRGVGKWEAAERHSGQSGAAVSIASAIRARSNTDAQADLKKIADMLQAGKAGPSVHRHPREVVARRLISAIMPRDIRVEADEVVVTLFRMAADVDGRTDDLEMDEELYGEADTLAKAYSNAVQDRRRERDSDDDDRPAHPDRAASGVQLP